MNPRTTGLLLIVTALLAAAVYWFEVRGKEVEEQQAEAEKLLFGELEAEAVTAISLETSDGESIRAERGEGGWQLTQPIDFPGDATSLDAMASALVGLKSVGQIEDAQAPAVYGLDAAAALIRFEAGETAHSLRIGKKTPVGGNSYARVGDGAEVYTVETFRTNSFERDLHSLREKRPIRFERADVREIAVRWQGGHVRLARESSEAQDWRLLEPIEARADEATVDGLLSDVSFLRAEGFQDEPSPDAEVGLDAPVLEIEVVSGEGDAATTAHLAIGTTLPNGRRVARGAEPALYELPAAKIDALPRDVVAYRYKTLARFVASDAQSFELWFDEPVSSASGPHKLSGQRTESGWTTEPEVLASDKPGRLISELARLDGTDIVAEDADAAVLAGYGLSPPRSRVRVLGTAPEEGEAPVLAEVHLGRIDADGIFATTARDPVVYRLDTALAEHVPVSLEALRNRFLAPPAPESDAPPEAGDPAAAAPEDAAAALESEPAEAAPPAEPAVAPDPPVPPAETPPPAE